MDAEDTQGSSSCVRKLVGRLRRSYNDVAPSDGQRFGADSKRDLPFFDNEDFCVWVDMKSWSLPRLGEDQEKRGSNISVVSAFKAIGRVVDPKVA